MSLNNHEFHSDEGVASTVDLGFSLLLALLRSHVNIPIGVQTTSLVTQLPAKAHGKAIDSTDSVYIRLNILFSKSPNSNTAL